MAKSFDSLDETFDITPAEVVPKAIKKAKPIRVHRTAEVPLHPILCRPQSKTEKTNHASIEKKVL